MRAEVRDRGHVIQVDEPRPFAGRGLALFIPLIATTGAGMRVPGVPPRSAGQRAEFRRRFRLQWWQPLALPLGWGVVLAGGLGTTSTGSAAWPVLTIVLGYAALIAGWVVSVNRRRGGAEPALLDAERLAKTRSWGIAWSGRAVRPRFSGSGSASRTGREPQVCSVFRWGRSSSG